ncbi:MAG: hypothetical protein WB048_08055, partial [Pseudolabrys sp.]
KNNGEFPYRCVFALYVVHTDIATRRRTWSPVKWPKLSLKALKWSMSVSISDSASFLEKASAIAFSKVCQRIFG